VPGSFAADGLAARIALEQAGAPEAVQDAFAALDTGDEERALDLLIGYLPSADGARDDIRRVVVGILDELGVENPLARESRRRLASALY
jgi:putative thioredoxin